MPLGEEGDWDHNERGWEWIGVDECDDLDGFAQAHFVGNEASVVGRPPLRGLAPERRSARGATDGAEPGFPDGCAFLLQTPVNTLLLVWLVVQVVELGEFLVRDWLLLLLLQHFDANQ